MVHCTSELGIPLMDPYPGGIITICCCSSRTSSGKLRRPPTRRRRTHRPVRGGRQTDFRDWIRDGDVPCYFDGVVLLLLVTTRRLRLRGSFLLRQRNMDSRRPRAQLRVLHRQQCGPCGSPAQKRQLDADGHGIGVVARRMGVLEMRRGETVQDGGCVAAMGDLNNYSSE